MAKTYKHIIFEKRELSTWITFNHPERHNSFDGDMCQEILEAVTTAAADSENAAIVLTGAGEKAFCAGGYLADLTNFNRKKGRHLFGQSLAAFNAIRSAPMPVIAAVNGFAVGGGNEFVIACDFAIASENAKFGQTGPRVGSSPIYGGNNLLTLSIGEKRAKEVCMMCRQYTAAEAYQMGWINKVVPQTDLHKEVDQWVQELADKAPTYIEITKVTSNLWWDMMKPFYSHAGMMNLLMAGSEEMIEGATSFMQKKKPDFRKFRANN